MPSNAHLNHLPLQAVCRSLASIATGLSRGPHGGSLDVLDLRPLPVLLNTVNQLRAASPYMNALILTVGPVVMLFIGVKMFVWKPLGLPNVVETASSYFTASITVPHDHMMNKQLVQWLTENCTTGTDMKNLTLHGRGAVNASNSIPEYSYHDQERIASLTYEPVANHNTAIWFANHKISIYREAPKQVQIHDYGGKPIQGKSRSREPDIVLSCFTLSASTRPIQQFLDHVRTSGEKQITPMTAFYRVEKYMEPEIMPWGEPVMRPSRSMDTIVMEEEKKSSLVQDVATYLSAESKAFYQSHGVPRRFGALFFGPPSTGKTSCAAALAGHSGLSVFIISLSSPVLDEDFLEQLFDRLPEKCLVLLEDVDSAGIKRE